MLCHKSVNSEQHIVSSDLIFKSSILDADSDLCALILELMNTLFLVRDRDIEENVNIHSSESSSSMLFHDSADSIMTEIEQDITVIFDTVTSSKVNLNIFITRNKTTMCELSSLSKSIISIEDMKKHMKLKTATVSNKMQQSKLISSFKLIIFIEDMKKHVKLKAATVNNKMQQSKSISLSTLIISIEDMKKHVKSEAATVSNKMWQSKLISSSKLIISIEDTEKHAELKTATVSNKMWYYEFKTQLNSLKLRNEIKDILFKLWTFSTFKKSLCSELDSELESVINEAVEENLSNVKNDAEISVSISEKWIQFMTSYRALLTSLTDWCRTYSEL